MHKEKSTVKNLTMSTTTGRSHQVTRKGTGAAASTRVKTTEQKTAGRQGLRAPAGTRKEKPVIELVLHPPEDPHEAEPDPGRTRSNPLVYEAMELLASYGYCPARISEPTLPINIIGMKKSGTLLVCALRSRLPVPNAATLRELYTGKVDYLRHLTGKVKDRIMIWVYSPACGWRYYLVYPGGLRYDLDFPKSIQ